MTMLKIHYNTSYPNQLDAKSDHTEMSYQPMLAAWAIKIAISCGSLRKKSRYKLPEMIREDGFLDLTGVHLPLEVDEDGDLKFFDKSNAKVTNAKLIKLFKSRLPELYKMDVPNDLPLFVNVELLGKIVGLSNAEMLILIFATALTAFPQFRKVISSANHSVSHTSLSKILQDTLGLPKSEIYSALREDSLLVLTGILEVSVGPTDLEHKIAVTDKFSEMLMMTGLSEDDLIKAFLRSTEKSCLDLSDYPHLANDIQVLSVYLANALTMKEKGVNVLFYGVPGTGKTELVKALATSLQANLFEIAYTDESGDPVKGDKRLKAFNLCQSFLVRKQNVMLLFDEVEDVFEKKNVFAMLFKEGSSTEKGKAWINRSMETGSTPAIWVTNDENIDPAYLRRFDYSVRFPIPPNKVRQKIARHHFSQFNPTEDWLSYIAANDQVSPAQLERAAKVARIAGAENFDLARKLVEQTLDRSVTLLGQKRVPSRNVLRTSYDLGFINTDLPVSKLVDAMKINPGGTFCFYGPAGTGKSELARFMADEIGKPLLLRRASDILSMYVGEAEKNIAQMFSEARQQDAVLLLDEADSFLADRRDAKRSWEVTQVNELLTQMEAFEGIFVCTTNLMNKLDQASLRRFAFKVKFDYLSSDQRWAMYLKELSRMGCDVGETAEWEYRVRSLDRLTPGDFAVVSRQASMLGQIPSARSVYEALAGECVIKDQTRKPMGFITS
jgi:transitional endoplasmic reticulum ATPase